LKTPRFSLLDIAFRDTRREMPKLCPIPPSLSYRNEIIRRFSTDRKLTSDIQRRETFTQTIAKFAQTFYRDTLSPLIVRNARINRIVNPGLKRRVKPCALKRHPRHWVESE
jgi:hypothetical protein